MAVVLTRVVPPVHRESRNQVYESMIDPLLVFATSPCSGRLPMEQIDQPPRLRAAQELTLRAVFYDGLTRRRRA